jgi:hypothetical protein
LNPGRLRKVGRAERKNCCGTPALCPTQGRMRYIRWFISWEGYGSNRSRLLLRKAFYCTNNFQVGLSNAIKFSEQPGSRLYLNGIGTPGAYTVTLSRLGRTKYTWSSTYDRLPFWQTGRKSAIYLLTVFLTVLIFLTSL